MEENINLLDIIRQHISTDVTAQDLINVFDILLQENMINHQEYSRAINKIKDKFNA